MMDTAIDHKSIIRMLSDINDNITSNESIISYQKCEILKTENVISQFQKCHKKQHDSLKLFYEEREKFKATRKELLQLLHESDSTNKDFCDDQENYDLPSSSEQYLLEYDLKPFDGADETGSSEALDCYRSRKIKRSYDETTDDPTKQCADFKMPKFVPCLLKTALFSAEMKNVRKVDIKLTGKTVHTIRTLRGCIYLGGSGGMLISHENDNTQIFETDITEDILQIEILKNGTHTSLLAFTKNSLLLYEDINDRSRCKELNLPERGDVASDNCVLYIPLKIGIIKKIVNTDLRLVKHVEHEQRDIRCFVPNARKNNRALISSEEALLYKTPFKTLEYVVPIRGISNVRKVLRFSSRFLCHSDDKIWFLSPDFEVLDTLELKSGIKFVWLGGKCGVVVTRENAVQVYSLLESGCFESKVFERVFKRSVTAVTVLKHNILVVVGHDLLAIPYQDKAAIESTVE